VDEFLRFIAVNAFIVNTDSYLRGGHNFYLYLDPADDKFRFFRGTRIWRWAGRRRGRVQRQLLQLGPRHPRPAGTDQPLIYWLLDEPAVYARYTAILRELGPRPSPSPN
jgi:hypothetical protein